MIVADLKTYLETKIAVVDALSHPVHGFRCYVDQAPQNVPYPLLLMQQISSTPFYRLDGESKLAEQTVELTVHAATAFEAAEIMEKIRLAPLSGYRGLLDATWCNLCKVESERQFTTPVRDGTDRPVHHAQADYRIFYQRTQPVLS